MAQRLSTSATFQRLEERVIALESDGALTQSKIINALGYTPANIAGDAFAYVNARTFIATLDGGGGSANLTGSSVPGYTGIVEFRGRDSVRNGFVGFNADGGPMHYGSDTGAGHYFEGGVISPDPSMKFGLRFNTIDGILDFDSGDYLCYSRSTDSFLFNVAGSTVASIDGTGIATPGKVYPGADTNFYAGIVSSQPRILWDSGDSMQYDRTANALTTYIGGTAQLTLSPSLAAFRDTITVGDGLFTASFNAGNPYIGFDSGDALLFNRGGNSYNFTLGNSSQVTISPTGTFVANVLTVGDGNFGMSLNGGAQPLTLYDSGDYASFIRSSNTYSWVVGNAQKASLDSSGNFTPAGYVAPSGDGNFLLQTASGNPQIVLDSGGDRIVYDRAANKFYFVIGGVNVASIDASGNLRIKGTLTASTTP